MNGRQTVVITTAWYMVIAACHISMWQAMTRHAQVWFTECRSLVMHMQHDVLHSEGADCSALAHCAPIEDPILTCKTSSRVLLPQGTSIRPSTSNTWQADQAN